MTTTAGGPFAGLAPAPLWSRFAELVRIPRPSGREEQAAAWVRAWADERGYEHEADATGNVVVRVPASAGREGAPAVVLQSHLDIVCERDPGSPHDAEAGKIRVVRTPDGWLEADGTTLGADNGIGVAAAMAAAEPGAPPHGPLELLFTIDEERGLTGASGLDPSILRGRILVNLDSEEDGALFVGCAGGTDTVISFEAPLEDAGGGQVALRVSVGGLRGGHSGIDIHTLRANAIKALAAALSEIDASAPLRVAHFSGGSKRNAIPRSAEATVLVDAGTVAAARTAAGAAEARLRERHAGADDALAVSVAGIEGDAPRAFGRERSRVLLDLVRGLPCGVLAMSADIPGLVETSTSIGVATTREGRVEMIAASRSSSSAAMAETLATIAAVARLAGAGARDEGSYPGWHPDLESRALAAARDAFRTTFGEEPEITAVHAGLECGLIGERVPGMDMISFGPDIAGPHAPGEKVRIASVERFATLLAATLDRLSR